jgi:DNA-binding MarR family transcriptional regulator
VTEDIAQRIWEWLPARTDSRRVTLPSTIATALDLDQREVSVALAEMERGGHVVRDRATGRQSGWHRGTPLPGTTPAQPEEGLW